MTDLLNIGRSALLAYQGALATTGHNIANASTAGYTRQRVDLVARTGTASVSGFSGAGVDATRVQRLADSFSISRLQADAAALSGQDTLSGLIGRVDQLLSDRSLGLTSSLSAFFAAADGVAADPNSSAARQVLLGSADSLSQRFNSLQTQLDGLANEVNGRVQRAVSEINGYSSAIAQLNDRIVVAQGNGGGVAPNDLLDQRDQLLAEMSSRIGISTALQEDGSLNVFTASGQALVLGTTVTKMSVVADPYDAGRLDPAVGEGGSAVDVASLLSGGELGGLMQFRSGALDAAMGDLGRLAVALAQTANDTQAQGIDLYGNFGGDLFTLPQASVTAHPANAGTASLAVSYGNVSQLTGDDYVMQYDGASWHLRESLTGSEITLSGAGTAGNPFTGAGLSIVVAGAASAGDRFKVEPGHSAAGQIGVAMTDPSGIAAAGAVRAQAALSNSGTGTISAPQTLDATDPALQTPATILFTSATTFTIDGNGPFAYTPGANIDWQGWRLQVAGSPAAGDTFQVTPVAAGSGDNRNARALAGLRSATVLDGGTHTIAGGYGALVVQTGTLAQQASRARDAQAAIQEQDQTARDSVAGVNLDEEAANMVRYQQAYQAAAQVIATAQTVFDSLLAAVRR